MAHNTRLGVPTGFLIGQHWSVDFLNNIVGYTSLGLSAAAADVIGRAKTT